MIETKLILVAGMSGSGKSTTAQNISIELERNGIPHVWMHEEIVDHPIRSHEFRVGDLYSKPDFRSNLDILIERWRDLAREVASSGRVYVLEGCLYQNIIRYFFEVDWPRPDIIGFYDRFERAVAPLKPALIFLYSSDAKATLQRVFPTRGEWWRKLILDPGECRYLRNRGLVGDEGIYAMWQDYQTLSNELFGRHQGNKLEIDTAQGRWETYHERVSEFLGMPAAEADDEPRFGPCAKDRCGVYRLANDRRQWIEIKCDALGLYCKAFWDRMPIVEFERDRFRFLSFPIELSFVREGEIRAVQLVGNYDWDLVGETLYHEKDMLH